MIQVHDSIQIQGRANVQRSTEPSAPGTLEMQKTCQGLYGPVRTLLFAYLFHLIK